MDPDEHHPEEQLRFKDKWSEDIYNLGGFTMIPNLLLVVAPELGLKPSELVLLINIESFRWATRMPYPSVQRLAERTGWDERHITRLVTSMSKKDLIWRSKRGLGKTNQYELYPLMTKLQDITILVKEHLKTHNRQNGHLGQDDNVSNNTTNQSAVVGTEASAKEDNYKTDLVNKIINQLLRTDDAKGNFLDKNLPFTGNLDDIDF